MGISAFDMIVERDIELINAFNKTMIRRGPDSGGIWTDHSNIVFGFRRLAIQDVNPRSSQPMCSEDGLHVLVYNGEIYNSASIRSELSDKVSFRTTSDTEVLLNALAVFGVDKVLSRIDGIFAFAYYNLQKKELIIARDRSGVKPLYYGIGANRLVFSSQYDHLISDPIIGRNSIDHNALSHYIDLGYVPEGEGILQNTYLLPHGCYARWSESGFSLVPYYEYPVVSNGGCFGDLANIIQKSVQEQLISDVPLGTFMSGGVDSTLVTCYSRRMVSGLETFNLGCVDARFDESVFAQEYSVIFDTQHQTRFFSDEDLLTVLDENLEAYSEPFSDYSSLPTLLLSRFAKQKVTVALSGDGGDELFWGYPRSEKAMRYSGYLHEGKTKLLYRFVTNRLIGKKKFPFALLGYSSFTEMYYNHLTVSGSQAWKRRILRDFSGPRPYFFNKSLQLESDISDLNGMMNLMRKLEFDLHLQRVLLKVDRASMFHSLEVRVPLLSNEMLNASAHFSFNQCYQNGAGKRPLRKILANHVGQRLAQLPKKGFVVPIDLWIRGRMKKLFYENILDMPASLNIYFKRNELEKMLDDHCKGNRDWSWIIWSLYTLSIWSVKHLKKG